MKKINIALTIRTAFSAYLMLSGVSLTAFATDKEQEKNTLKRLSSEIDIKEKKNSKVKFSKSQLSEFAERDLKEAADLCLNQDTLVKGIEKYIHVIKQSSKNTNDPNFYRIEASAHLVDLLEKQVLDDEKQREIRKLTLDFLKKQLDNKHVKLDKKILCLKILARPSFQSDDSLKNKLIDLSLDIYSIYFSTFTELKGTLLTLAPGQDGFKICLSRLEKIEDPIRRIRAVTALFCSYGESIHLKDMQEEIKGKIFKIFEEFQQSDTKIESNPDLGMTMEIGRVVMILNPNSEGVSFCLSLLKKIEDPAARTLILKHLLDTTFMSQYMKEKTKSEFHKLITGLIEELLSDEKMDSSLNAALTILLEMYPGEESAPYILSLLRNKLSSITHWAVLLSLFEERFLKDFSPKTKMLLNKELLALEKGIVPNQISENQFYLSGSDAFTLEAPLLLLISEFLQEDQNLSSKELGIKINFSIFDLFIKSLEGDSISCPFIINDTIYKLLSNLLKKMEVLEKNEEMKHLLLISDYKAKSTVIQKYQDKEGQVDLLNSLVNSAVALACHDKIDIPQKLDILKILLQDAPLQAKKWAYSEIVKHVDNQKLLPSERIKAIEILLQYSDDKNEIKKIAIEWIKGNKLNLPSSIDYIKTFKILAEHSDITEEEITTLLDSIFGSFLPDDKTSLDSREANSQLIFSECRKFFQSKNKKFTNSVAQFLTTHLKKFDAVTKGDVIAVLVQNCEITKDWATTLRDFYITHFKQNTQYVESSAFTLILNLYKISNSVFTPTVLNYLLFHLKDHVVEKVGYVVYFALHDPKTQEKALFDITVHHDIEKNLDTPYAVHGKLLEKRLENVTHTQDVYDIKLSENETKGLVFSIDKIKKPFEVEKLPAVTHEDFISLIKEIFKEAKESVKVQENLDTLLSFTMKNQTGEAVIIKTTEEKIFKEATDPYFKKLFIDLTNSDESELVGDATRMIHEITDHAQKLSKKGEDDQLSPQARFMIQFMMNAINCEFGKDQSLSQTYYAMKDDKLVKEEDLYGLKIQEFYTKLIDHHSRKFRKDLLNGEGPLVYELTNTANQDLDLGNKVIQPPHQERYVESVLEDELGLRLSESEVPFDKYGASTISSYLRNLSRQSILDTFYKYNTPENVVNKITNILNERIQKANIRRKGSPIGDILEILESKLDEAITGGLFYETDKEINEFDNETLISQIGTALLMQKLGFLEEKKEIMIIDETDQFLDGFNTLNEDNISTSDFDVDQFFSDNM